MSKKLCKSCDGKGKDIFDKSECTWCNGSGFDILSTDNIVCPYCGYENEYSWEFSENSDNEKVYSCPSCDKNSLLYINHSVDYTTSKAECLNDESKHDFKVHDYMPIRDNGDKYHTCRICRKSKWMKESEVKSE